MIILLFDPMPALESALHLLGHEVHAARFASGGICHLPGILRRMKLAPDLVLQQESLGKRLYLSGLETCECPTMFWAIDSHLNMFWQQWYGLLFDAVLTPHVSLFRALPAERRPRELHRFAQAGQRRQWVPHGQRRRDMAMCARLTDSRPMRAWLVDLLRPLGLDVTENLSFDAMMRLYDDTRVALNECIANEVNFRLMEGASSGCLVLSPDVGEDQDALLRPGEEFLLYHDGLELLEQVSWAKRRPESAERVGKAAMQRIQAEHLPEHRADFLVRLASRLSQSRLTGKATSLAMWLVRAVQIRNGTIDASPHEHARLGLRMAYSLPAWRELPLSLRPFVSHTITQSLCLFAEKDAHQACSGQDGVPALLPGGGVSWPVDDAYALCRNLLADSRKVSNRATADGPAPPQAPFAASGREPNPASVSDGPLREASSFLPSFPANDCSSASPLPGEPEACAGHACPSPAHTLEVASTASHFAVRQGQFRMALAFWMLHAGKSAGAPPRDVSSLCLYWAAAWQRQGTIFTSGFSYVSEKGFLPESALSCLLFAQTFSPEAHSRIFKRLAALLAGKRAFLHLRVGCLAKNCLAEQDNWRTQLEYALACIQSCRVEAGLFEAKEAATKALRQGQSPAFQNRLFAAPGGRRIWESLQR
ncbi:MAG: glycosyltransferase [Desulfovibrio sp.]|jgi:hypothetical protein|nr:glycosyltransferase [Desulfovibrio sp.]